MEKKIFITGRDCIVYGKHCDGYYFISPSLQFAVDPCYGKIFYFYDEYKSALSKTKKIVKPFINEEKYSHLDKEQCKDLLSNLQNVLSDYLSA